MIRKFLLSLIVFIAASTLYASMAGHAESHPTSVYLSWSSVDGALYYDIYNGQDFVVRLDSSSSSYLASSLDSDKSYSFAIAARDGSNNTLDSIWLNAATTSWDGTYLWENKTTHNNKGKVREIRMRIKAVTDASYGQYNEVFLIIDGKEIKIFPLFPFGSEDANIWHKYKEDSIGGISYRTNAGLFNTSSMTPSKWKISKIVIDRDFTSAYIQTSALSFIFDTESSYRLFEKDGRMYLEFKTESEQSIVDNALFKNPNPGEGDAFILEKID